MSKRILGIKELLRAASSEKKKSHKFASRFLSAFNALDEDLKKEAAEKDYKYLVGINRKGLRVERGPEEDNKAYHSRISVLAEDGPVFSKETLDFIKNEVEDDILPEDGRRPFVRWLGNAIEASERFPDINQVAQIKDWLTGINWTKNEELDLDNLTLDAAILESSSFHEEASYDDVTEDDKGFEKQIISMFDGGFKIVYEPTNSEAPGVRKALGRRLGICLAQGLYGDDTSGKIYSLRDQKGKAYVAIRILDNVIQEIKGKNNRPPVRIYIAKIIRKWVLESGFEFSNMGKEDFDGLPPINWEDAKNKLENLGSFESGYRTFIKNGWFHTYRKQFVPYMEDILYSAIGKKPWDPRYKYGVTTKYGTAGGALEEAVRSGAHHVYKDFFERNLEDIAKFQPHIYIWEDFPKTFGKDNPTNKIAVETLAVENPTSILSILYPWSGKSRVYETITKVSGVRDLALNQLNNRIDEVLESGLTKDKNKFVGTETDNIEKGSFINAIPLNIITRPLTGISRDYPNLIAKILKVAKMAKEVKHFRGNIFYRRVSEVVAEKRLYRSGGIAKEIFDNYMVMIKEEPERFFSSKLYKSKEYSSLTDEFAMKILDLRTGYYKFITLELFRIKQISREVKEAAAYSLLENRPIQVFKEKQLKEGLDDDFYNNLIGQALIKLKNKGNLEVYILKYLKEEQLKDPGVQELFLSGNVPVKIKYNSENLINLDYHIKHPFLEEILINGLGDMAINLISRISSEYILNLLAHNTRPLSMFFKNNFEEKNPELGLKLINAYIQAIKDLMDPNKINPSGTDDVRKSQFKKRKELAQELAFKFFYLRLHKKYPEAMNLIANIIVKEFPLELGESNLSHWGLFGGVHSKRVHEAFKEYYYGNPEYKDLGLYQKDLSVIDEFKDNLSSVLVRYGDKSIEGLVKGFMLWSALNLTDFGRESVNAVFGVEPEEMTISFSSSVDDGYNFRQALEFNNNKEIITIDLSADDREDPPDEAETYEALFGRALGYEPEEYEEEDEEESGRRNISSEEELFSPEELQQEREIEEWIAQKEREESQLQSEPTLEPMTTDEEWEGRRVSLQEEAPDEETYGDEYEQALGYDRRSKELDKLFKLTKKSEDRDVSRYEKYIKHTALNLGQAARDARYIHDYPGAEGIMESVKLRLNSLANNLYYATIPPWTHHSDEELKDVAKATVMEWFNHGYAPWDHPIDEPEEEIKTAKRSIANEENTEQYLRTFLKNPNFYENIMMKHDVTPYRSQDTGTSKLGSGAFGEVLQGIYNGKPVAVKIMSGEEQDVKIWKDILEEKKSLPKELSRHLPEVYFTGGGESEVRLPGKLRSMTSMDDQRYLMTVMEVLSPLPREIKQLFNRLEVNPVASLTIKQPEVIYKVIVRSVDKGLYELKEDETLSDFIESSGKSWQQVRTELINDLHYNAMNVISSLQKEHADYDFGFFVGESTKNNINNIMNKICGSNACGNIPDLGNIISAEFNMQISKVSQGFPEDSSGVGTSIVRAPNDEAGETYEKKRDSLIKEFPEFRTFLAMLEALREKGIHWEDVHQFNVMLRPSTGDLVLVDVGLFYIDKQSSISNRVKIANTEEDSKHLRDLVSNPNIYERIMLKHDIIPHRSAEGRSSKLGKGAFGTVIRGVYNGKPVAAKIMDYNDKDIEVWNSIIEYKESLSEKHRRHLPEVYLLEQDQIKVSPSELIPRQLSYYYKEGNEYLPYSITAMEILRPIPKEVKDYFSDYFMEMNERPRVVLNSPEFMFGVLNNAVTLAIHQSYVEDRDHTEDYIYQSGKGVGQISKELATLLLKHLMEDSDYSLYVNKHIIDSYLAQICSNCDIPVGLSRLVAKTFYSLKERAKESFPENYDSHSNIPTEIEELGKSKRKPDSSFKELPEFKTIIEMLEELYQRGVLWSDLHAGNIMMRPSTGDLVITDVGNFIIRRTNEAKDPAPFRQNYDYTGNWQEKVRKRTVRKARLKAVRRKDE
jgi:serine/threonine protein kinase